MIYCSRNSVKIEQAKVTASDLMTRSGPLVNVRLRLSKGKQTQGSSESQQTAVVIIKNGHYYSELGHRLGVGLF